MGWRMSALYCLGMATVAAAVIIEWGRPSAIRTGLYAVGAATAVTVATIWLLDPHRRMRHGRPKVVRTVGKVRTLTAQDLGLDTTDTSDTGAAYCPGCSHPWSYHGQGGCSMPVVRGTNRPVVTQTEQILSERCACQEQEDLWPAVDADPDTFKRTSCGCGYVIVLTPEGWQHEAAPWFWGDDHDASPW
jgi:hypothetical protein